MRKGAILRISTKGIVERNTSSKKRVKSNPPRHSGPAHGPNVLSTKAQSVVVLDAMEITKDMVPVPQNVAQDAR